MPHAMQIRQTGGPEVLNWTAVEAGEPVLPSQKGSLFLTRPLLFNQRFALKDAAEAHKALEARATSGTTF
jgi:hypothetical protein